MYIYFGETMIKLKPTVGLHYFSGGDPGGAAAAAAPKQNIGIWEGRG